LANYVGKKANQGYGLISTFYACYRQGAVIAILQNVLADNIYATITTQEHNKDNILTQVISTCQA